MRASSCVLFLAIAFGLPAIRSAAESDLATPPTDVAPDRVTPQVSEALMTGAELFDKEWRHFSAKERAEMGAPEQSKSDAETRVAAAVLKKGTAARGRALGHAFDKTDIGDLTREQRQALARFHTSSRGRRVGQIGTGHGDGLGPLFNATSCADCHPGGGASGVQHNVTLITIDPRSEAFENVTAKSAQQLSDVFPGLFNELGVLSIEKVVHDQSAHDGYATIRAQLAHYVPDGIKAAWFEPEKRTSQAIAERPVVAGRHGGVDFYLSQRNTPALFGLGQIDRISMGRLHRLAEAQAEEGRVSGRVAKKFGWRGQIDSVGNFVSQACAGEMGLTQMNNFQPGDPANIHYHPPGFDMTLEDVANLVTFVSLLPTPIERNLDQHSDTNVFHGEKVFNAIGCADCHVPDVEPALNMFSDLLLHDMGEDLQAASPAALGDLRPAGILKAKKYPVMGPISGGEESYGGMSTEDFLPIPELLAQPEQPQFPRGPRARSYEESPNVSLVAERGIPAKAGKSSQRVLTIINSVTWDDLQREWRTPPLWGIADTGPYLHDGRAETLAEAILWHGGEAQASRDEFVALGAVEKEQVIEFLSSLRAPEESQSVKRGFAARVD